METVIRFRGRLAKPSQIETFEDRLIEVALAVSGYARIWRSVATPQTTRAKRIKRAKSERAAKAGAAEKPRPEPRMIRGALLNLWPGAETISLMLSPEGLLVPYEFLAEAERGPLTATPWIQVRTGHAPPEAHAVLHEMLAALREKLIPELEIEDSAGYATGAPLGVILSARGETPEPREAQAMAQRVAQAIEQVRQAVLRPAEHPPVQFAGEDDEDFDPQCFGTEAEWDASYQEQVRRQSRMMRGMEERTLLGQDPSEAFDATLRDEGITGLPGEEEEDPVETAFEDAGPPEESWKQPAEEETGDDEEEGAEDESDLTAARRRRRNHPLMQQSEKLTMRVLRMPDRKNAGPESYLGQAIHGILEISGGLSQALGSNAEEGDESDTYGLVLVQLKRAMQGAVFARAALPPARELSQLSKTDYARLTKELQELEAAIAAEIAQARAKLQGA
ncbi:MAG: hypothetical protein KIS92_00200 [Planctomycetota bacterium]|nr:hypothetical protein [Planctomycetota bacterium]